MQEAKDYFDTRRHFVFTRFRKLRVLISKAFQVQEIEQAWLFRKKNSVNQEKNLNNFVIAENRASTLRRF